MVIKDLFNKLIQNEAMRKDVEDMIMGKGKFISVESMNSEGKKFQELVPLRATFEKDLAAFKKFNNSNIKNNIADNLYKFYKQRQQNLYRSYVKQIQNAVKFYDEQLSKIYGKDFVEQLTSIKEKEETYIKMKSLGLDSSSVGSKILNDINKIKKSSNYAANKTEYDKKIAELKKIYETMKITELKSSNAHITDTTATISSKAEEYIESNNFVRNRITDLISKNERTLAGMVEKAVGNLNHLSTMIKPLSSTNKSYRNVQKQIEKIMSSIDTASGKGDINSLLELSMSTSSIMQAISKMSEDSKKVTSPSNLSDINKAKKELELRLSAKENLKKMDLKLSNKEKATNEDYQRTLALADPKKIESQKKRIAELEALGLESINAQKNMYDDIIKAVQDVMFDIKNKTMEVSTVESEIERASGDQTKIEVNDINDGNITDTAKLLQEQIDLSEEIGKELSNLQNIRENLQSSGNIDSSEKSLNEMNNQIGHLEGNIISPSEYIEGMMKDFGTYMLRIRLVQRGIQDITNAIGAFQKVDDEAFQLGMVSGMNVGSIKAYRNEVLGLAADYRATAEEILSSQSEIIKTGRTFDQAKQQVSASLILARSTFEDLNSSADVLNKLMLTLEISGDKSYESMSKLYNVVQNTPASLAGMEAAMRQSSSAFSGLLDEINYSGTQLEKYKGELRDAELSLLGFVNLQGKTPQMAGTAVKTLIDKMRSPTTKAVTTINEDLSKSNATYQGTQVTTDMISRLTETNFDEAINLLSKLYVNGNLTYKAIQDMFGPRNAATLSKLLYQVNGDIIGSSGDMLTKLDPLKDSKKLNQSWSQEIEELKNSFRALKGVTNDFGDALLPVIDIVGESVQGFAKFVNQSTGAKAAMQTGAGVFAVGKVAKEIALSTYAMNQQSSGQTIGVEYQEYAMMGNIFRQLNKDGKIVIPTLSAVGSGLLNIGKTALALITSPLGLWISGITIALSALTYVLKSHNEKVSKTNQSYLDMTNRLEESEEAIKLTNSSLLSISQTMKNLDPTAFRASSSINLLSQEIKNMLDLTLDYTGKLSSFTRESALSSTIKENKAILTDSSKSDDEKEMAKLRIKTAEKFINNPPTESEKSKYLKIKDSISLLSEYQDKRFSGDKELEIIEKILKFSSVDLSGAKKRKQSNKDYIKDILYMSGTKSFETGEWTTDARKENIASSTLDKEDKKVYEAIENLNKTTFGGSAITIDGIEVTESSNKLLEEANIFTEIMATLDKATSDNMDSINAALSQKMQSIQNINNLITSVIKENQSSIFINQGNIISQQSKVDFLKRTDTFKKLIDEDGGIVKKISEIGNKETIRYMENLAVIKKNEELFKADLDRFSNLSGDRKSANGEKLIGSIKPVSELMNDIFRARVDIYGKQKSFEEITGISQPDLRNIVKNSKSSNELKQKVKEITKDKSKETSDAIDKIMNVIITEKFSSNISKNQYSKLLLKNFVGENGDINNLSDVMKGRKSFEKNIEAQIEVYINTANEEVASYMLGMLKDAPIQLSEIISARASKKGLEDNKILMSINESQRAMDALMLEYQNRISTAQVALSNAQSRLQHGIKEDFITNKKNEYTTTISSWKASTEADLAPSMQVIELSTEEKNKIIKAQIAEYSKRNKKDNAYTERLYKEYSKPVISTDKSTLTKQESDELNIIRGYSENVFINKKELKAKGQLQDMMNKIINSVDSEGTLTKSYYKYLKKMPKENEAIFKNKVNEFMQIRSGLFNSLSIADGDIQKAKEELKQYENDYKHAILSKNIEGMQGAGATGSSVIKSISLNTSKIDLATQESFKTVSKIPKKILDDITNNINNGDFQKAISSIFDNKELTQIQKSALKEWVSSVSKIKVEEVTATTELIEQLRKFKNELISDIYKINLEIGKGSTTNYKEQDTSDYISNQELISSKYNEIKQMLLPYKNAKVMKDIEGNTTISGVTNDNDRDKINTLFVEIGELQKKNEDLNIEIQSKINSLVQEKKELPFQTRQREYDKIITGTDKNSKQSIFNQNEASFDIRLGKSNAFASSMMDILSSASSIPNVQKQIAEYQIKILENTKRELENKYNALGESTSLIDIEKTKIQIAMQQVELAKKTTETKLTQLENDKKYNQIMKERADILGEFRSPEKNFEENLEIAKRQMQITLEQMDIEEEQNRNVKQLISNMGSLEDVIRKETESKSPNYRKELEIKNKDSVKNIDKSKSLEDAMKEANDLLKTDSNTNNENNKDIKTEVTDVVDTAKQYDEVISNSMKRRLVIEQYINDIYKARKQYVDEINKKYKGYFDIFEGAVTGNFSKLNQQKTGLSEGLSDAFASHTAYNDTKTNKNKKTSKDIANAILLSGNPEQSGKDSLGDYSKNFLESNKGLLEKLKGAKTNEEKTNLLNTENINTTDIEAKQTADAKAQVANAIGKAVQAAGEAVISFRNNYNMEKLKGELEQLQFEEKILSLRKSGYRTEYAKYQIEKLEYQNKIDQINAEYKIAQTQSTNESAVTMTNIASTVGSAVGIANPLAGAIITGLSPLIGKATSGLIKDPTAKMERDKQMAYAETEQNFKEYNNFWTLFFNTINKITEVAQNSISSAVEDYSKGRNLKRFNQSISLQNKLNEIALNSLNDFEGIATASYQKTYKKKVLGVTTSKKKQTISTDYNYQFEDLTLEAMKDMISLSDDVLRKKMEEEALIDNVDAKGTWSITDEALTDFRDSLIEAVDTIEYLNRTMNSLPDKLFYSNKEGYASSNEQDIADKYSELISNALSAGDTTLANRLKLQKATELQPFIDAGTSEIYYSTFSSILMDAARKVAQEKGDFSKAYATAIGSVFGTQFSNIISQIIDKAVPDNSELDTYMENFATNLKNYNGDISLFIKDGVLDMQELSQSIGSGDFLSNISNAVKELSDIDSINLYKTSQSVAKALRERGISETQIATFLESSNLVDPLKVAVEKISNIFNPVAMSSGKIAMQRESFDAQNSTQLDELRRKKILGTITQQEQAVLDNLNLENFKLSIKENVASGFESGIKNAITKTTYSDIFAEFGNQIGEAINNKRLSNMDISSDTTEIANLISSGNYRNAAISISELSKKVLNANAESIKIVKELRNQGLDYTEIEKMNISTNIYQKVEDILQGNDSLKNSLAKYEKQLIDYNTTMANDKYTNEEYYTELNKRMANGEILKSSEQEWLENYDNGLNKIINKQSLLNNLQSNFNDILSNQTAVDFMKTIGRSLGSVYSSIIVQSLNANSIMESLIENATNGVSIEKDLENLSNLFETAKNKQRVLKQQMLSQGNSYTMIESIFGEDAYSKIADIYGEMQNYSNMLAKIEGQEVSYKNTLTELSGVQYTYEEYYRELSLKKANNITLTKEETEWMDKYSKSVKEFETNKSIITNFYGAVKASFSKSSSKEIFGEFASGFSDMLTEKIVNGYLTTEFADDMANAVSLAQQALTSGSVQDLYNAQQSLFAFSTQIEVAKNQTQGLLDMFDSSKVIDVTDKTKDIQYSSSSSKDVTYNITQNLSINAGTIVADSVSIDKFASAIAPAIKKAIDKL